MILVPRSVRVYFATQPTNLRKSFEGLSNEVREVLRHDPLGGHIVVFLCRDQIDEFMAEAAIPESTALEAAEEFVATQKRPSSVKWEADWGEG